MVTEETDKINTTLQRPGVVRFLEERTTICTCGKVVPPTGDGHFVRLLLASMEDTRSERSNGIEIAGRYCNHYQKRRRCPGDTDFRRRIDTEDPWYDPKLAELARILATGEIKNEGSGRWAFVVRETVT